MMVAPQASTETTGTTFDPRQRRRPRRAVGSPPPRQLPIEGARRWGRGVVKRPATGGRLPGRQRRPGSREIHVALSEKAYRLLETVRADNPGTSYGDLIAVGASGPNRLWSPSGQRRPRIPSSVRSAPSGSTSKGAPAPGRSTSPRPKPTPSAPWPTKSASPTSRSSSTAPLS